MDSRCSSDARQTLVPGDATVESRPETSEVQIHVSGIMLHYKSRNYVNRDKHAEKRENTIIFRAFNVGLCHCVYTFHVDYC